MKNILLIVISFFLLIPNSFAATGTNTQLTASSVMSSITEVMNTLAEYKAFDNDVAKERIGHYSDKIYRFGTELSLVVEESEKWTRDELIKSMNRRLVVLKEQWFLTTEVYNTNVSTYTNWFSTGTFLWLPKIYKDFNEFYDANLYSTVPQDALYKKLKLRVEALLSERKITKDKHDTWLVKLHTQIYQHKSDAEYITALFEDETLNYTEVLPVIDTTSTWDKVFDGYYAAVKKTSLKRFERTAVKNLKVQLTRAKKTLAKYKVGTKQEKKQRALVKLLEEVIAKK